MSTVDGTTSTISWQDERDGRGLRGLRALAGLFLATAVGFFPLIMNPLVFGYFDAETDADRLEHVDEHFTGLRVVFTGIGVTEVALGFALWIWGRRVASVTPGRRGRIASATGGLSLLAGLAWLVTRVAPWFASAEELANDDLSAFDLAVGVVGGAGFSIAFVVFGYLMVRGVMPTWLGVLWVICGVMFWLGILPLWFFVAALAFGIRGVVRFRDGLPLVDQISGVRPDVA